MRGAMARYAVLLRAVNVGGNSLRMADVRKALEPLFPDVATYIQSGNVVVAAKEKADEVAEKVAGALAALGYDGPVFVRSHEELAAAAAANPFDPERLADRQRCHLMFLEGRPAAERVQRLMGMEGDEYRFHVQDRVLYYAYDRAFEGPRRRRIPFEKVLGTPGTARAWNVVERLIAMTS